MFSPSMKTPTLDWPLALRMVRLPLLITCLQGYDTALIHDILRAP